MNAQTFALLSGALTFGVPCAVAIGELIALRRPRGDGWPPDSAPPIKPAPKPLPDCLIPKRLPSPATPSVARHLEPV
jgi:hypothetical protein